MIGFFAGALVTGIVLGLVFGVLHLETEEKAYWRGYHDGKNEKSSCKVSESTYREHGSDV